MKPTVPLRVRVIDSHTAGEATRVVVSGVPEPAGNSMAEKRANFCRDLDWIRSAAVCEPRGHEGMVGALLCEPAEEGCVAGVIFFNNVGALSGCLHGTMGVAVTLVHEGKIGAGEHRFDTPAGGVKVSVADSGRVTVGNVRSYRFQEGIQVEIPGFEAVTGDVAWGGNWFFLAEPPPGMEVEAGNIEALTRFAWRIRKQLSSSGITGEGGAEIDHIELFGPPGDPALADSRNFVLCPGKVHDRSPCGTGVSAKLACLHAAGRLKAGERWRQAGILDTVFEGVVETAPEGGVYPTVTGSAHVTAEAELIIDPSAPFAYGIPPDVSRNGAITNSGGPGA